MDSDAIIIDANITKFNNTALNYFNENINISLTHEEYPILTVFGNDSVNIGITDMGLPDVRTIHRYYPNKGDEWFPIITTGAYNTLYGQFKVGDTSILKTVPKTSDIEENGYGFINGSMIQFSPFSEAIYHSLPTEPETPDNGGGDNGGGDNGGDNGGDHGEGYSDYYDMSQDYYTDESPLSNIITSDTVISLI